MNEFDVAWVSGLLEGEGCFFYNRRKEGQCFIGIRLSMTDRDVVEKYSRLVKATANIIVYEPKKDQIGQKIQFSICINGYAAHRLMTQIYPHMGERRKGQIDEALYQWSLVPHKREKGLPPTCHPERKHHSNGLCRSCASLAWFHKYGVRPRSQSLMRTKPWEKDGMSRNRWYRTGRHLTYKSATKAA